MSETKLSLIDLGKLSKPACKLIDAVSSCIGEIYRPTGIRRVAKAEGDAQIILAKADIEKQKLFHRAAYRLTLQEIRRQENIERIVSKAVKALPEEVSQKPVDPDWLSRFFDECKNVSDEQLQELWAKLLAGEVAEPSSFSRRTLSILRDFTTEDVRVFEQACSQLWRLEGGLFMPWDIKGSEAMARSLRQSRSLDTYRTLWINCRVHLESLGLIYGEGRFTATGVRKKLGTGVRLDYFHWKHRIGASTAPSGLAAAAAVRHGPFVPFTRSGKELYAIARPAPDKEYYKLMLGCLSFWLAVDIEPADNQPSPSAET